MANLAWPSELIPFEFTLARFTKVFRGKSVFGRSGQNLDTLNDRWTVSMSCSAKNSSVAASIEAFIANMRNGANTVDIYHFARPSVSGSLTGVPSAFSTGQGSQVLTVSAPNGSALKSGDMLSVGGMLNQVSEDCTASAGSLTIPLVMRLRKPVSAGEAVILDKPTARFRLAESISPTYGPGGYIMSMGLNFVEVL